MIRMLLRSPSLDSNANFVLTAIDNQTVPADGERLLYTLLESFRDPERHVRVPAVRRDVGCGTHHRKLGFCPGA